MRWSLSRRGFLGILAAAFAWFFVPALAQEDDRKGRRSGGRRRGPDEYKKGTFLGNSGHVRVTVSADEVKVDYVRSCLPNDETDQRKNGALADSYTIKRKDANMLGTP